MRVEAVIIGAQKCGTSSLAYMISQHPEICFSSIKEPHFFSTVNNWKDNLDQYHSLFAPKIGQICCEASTSYTFYPRYKGTHLRLYEYNPTLKLIYIMRHPIRRIISHYNHRLIRQNLKVPLETAIKEDRSYIDISRYGMQIKPYFDIFPIDNIFLIIFEEFIQNPQRGLEKLFHFLHISSEHTKSIRYSHKNISIQNLVLKKANSFLDRKNMFLIQKFLIKIYSIMMKKNENEYLPAAYRKYLWSLLEHDIKFIESLLKRRLYIWRNG